MSECKVVKKLSGGRYDTWHDIMRRVYDTEGLSPTIHTMAGGNMEPKILYKVRVRKLTERECWRLMGAGDDDFDKAVAAGVSKTQLYRQAGNGIVKNVLMAIFGQLYGIDWKPLVYGEYYKTETERINDLPLLQRGSPAADLSDI